MDLPKYLKGEAIMKKLITLVLTLALLASLFVLPSAALTEAEIGALKYTVLQQSINGYSYSADDVLFAGKYCMRGMAISQDGKYMFGGFLNPNGSSAIEMWETATGKIVSGLQFIQAENNKSSYPKGLATDDRGYLYAALAYNPNNTKADLAVYSYADGLKLVSHTNIATTSPDIKTGVNGITVEKINGIYYAYVVVNYDVDYLIRVNVNDPANPVLDTAFGKDGVLDLQGAPYNLKEANYLDVDTDGTIYLGCQTQSDKVLMVLSADASTIITTISHPTAYGVALWGDYIFVTTQKTGNVGIYNKYTYQPVGTIAVSTDNIVLPISRDDILINAGVSSLCNVAVINDILFLGDQANDANGCDQILAVGLTDAAAKTVASWSSAIGERLAAAYPEKTEAPETTKAPETEPVTEVPETDPATEPATEAPETQAPATEAPNVEVDYVDEKSGCGGMIASAAVIVAILGAAVVFKKKD
jgi:hypothetical protein